MSSKRAFVFAIFIGAIIVTMAAYILTRVELNQDRQAEKAPKSPVATAQIPAQESESSPSATSKNFSFTIDKPSISERGGVELKLTEQTRAQLLDVSALARKAFTTDEEKSHRNTLMRDEKFLREIATTLKSNLLDEETKRAQYQAIDFLIDARVNGKSELAGELLSGIISGNQIENPTLANDVRENLAGIKAEVLYQWTAKDPSAANNIAPLLPGPTSKKIWANVRSNQANNASESSRLLR